jgi:uncharacterized protein (DUF2147 family)
MLHITIRICLLALWLSPGAALADVLAGRWVTGNGQAVIELVHEGRGFRAVLLAAVPPPQVDPYRSLVDANNPDPSLRQRPLADLELGYLEPSGDDRWSGRLYDPESGDAFKVEATRLRPGVIELRGYVGIPAFGRTVHWVSLALHQKRQRKLWAAGDDHE